MAPVKDAGAAGPMFPLRAVVLGAFVPSLLFSTGTGVVLPLIPLSATALGADLAGAGLAAAMMPLGKVLADLPAGALAARIGDGAAMVLAALLGLAAFVGAALAPSLVVLGASVGGLGAATAVFHLARHAYLTEITPAERRARVLSTLGGMNRIGMFLGPFLGASVIAAAGMTPAYWVASGCAALALSVLLGVRDTGRARAARPATGLGGLARQHRRMLFTLGTATLLVGAVRGARQTVVPLWGEAQGFPPEAVAALFGLSGALDVLLFYPAGKIMDRHGRLWIAVPSMALIVLAMALLPLTETVGAVAVVACLLGLGNGLGSGIIMTLGADVAPEHDRAGFLGLWRLFQDTGEAVGPLLLSAGAALSSLAVGVWCVSAVGLGAAGALQRWVPRYSVHANRTTRRRAGLA